MPIAVPSEPAVRVEARTNAVATYHRAVAQTEGATMDVMPFRYQFTSSRCGLNTGETPRIENADEDAEDIADALAALADHERIPYEEVRAELDLR